MAWAEKCFRESLRQGQGRVPVKQTRLTLHNLHGQTTDKFKAYIKNESKSLVWLYPAGSTDALQPIDAGLGAFSNVDVGEQLDLSLENGDNLERREGNALTASDRRLLLTKLVATAIDTVDNRAGYGSRLFEENGSLMSTERDRL